MEFDPKMLYLKHFRYRSFLLEGDARHAEEGLADFLGAFDVGDLEESFGRVVEEPRKIRGGTCGDVRNDACG